MFQNSKFQNNAWQVEPGSSKKKKKHVMPICDIILFLIKERFSECFPYVNTKLLVRTILFMLQTFLAIKMCLSEITILHSGILWSISLSEHLEWMYRCLSVLTPKIVTLLFRFSSVIGKLTPLSKLTLPNIIHHICKRVSDVIKKKLVHLFSR